MSCLTLLLLWWRIASNIKTKQIFRPLCCVCQVCCHSNKKSDWYGDQLNSLKSAIRQFCHAITQYSLKLLFIFLHDFSFVVTTWLTIWHKDCVLFLTALWILALLASSLYFLITCKKGEFFSFFLEYIIIISLLILIVLCI